MADSYVGEIRLVGFNYAPVGWALCQGQLLAISQNDVLYNLIGTTYGGDGVNTFALPDLRGRVPVHVGTSQGATYPLGQLAGSYQVTLVASQVPSHNHLINCQNGSSGASGSPANNYFALASKLVYATPGTLATMGSIVGSTGGSQPHDNMQPYLAVNYIISLYGSYPTQA
jgi:microcystin-dependent protein